MKISNSVCLVFSYANLNSDLAQNCHVWVDLGEYFKACNSYPFFIWWVVKKIPLSSLSWIILHLVFNLFCENLLWSTSNFLWQMLHFFWQAEKTSSNIFVCRICLESRRASKLWSLVFRSTQICQLDWHS